MLRMCCFFLFSACVAFGQAPPCDLKRDRDGVRVFTCKVPGEKFRSLRAEFTLENFSLSQLETWIRDVPNYVNWQYNMTEAEILEEVSPDALIIRSVVDAPWPVENREMITECVFDHSTPGALRIMVKSIPHDYPTSDDLVRVPYSLAQWNVTQTGGDLAVVYSLEIDPGGSVPPVLVNLAMAEGPHHSFRDLKKLLASKKN
ncbi:MAG: START domain-containing protein [Cyclobacteriaceae bacterium]|jgi:hypothetical protein